jgi:RNA polymerase sigma-70 factor (ECF subfamily)
VTTPVLGAETASVGPELADAALAAAGDARAFERLYRSHAARVHGLARRMMGGEHAADLTQDVFVRAWEKLGTFRGEAAFGTWLYRLAVNVILNRRSSRAADRNRVDDPEAAFATLAAKRGPEGLALDFEGAIERLPEGARLVFVLHDVEGYTHEEIAEWLGVTSGTTKAQLHRARLILRRYLDG